MIHEHTEPHYKDHTVHGGLKLHAVFSTDRLGRNTLELVCPALRSMDADSVEGFLELTKDRVKETLNAMRKASPDGKIDCRIVGQKTDRIMLKGDNEGLIRIAQGVQAMSEDVITTPPEATRENVNSRREMILTAIASKTSPTLMHQLGSTDPMGPCDMFIQLKGVRFAHNPQAYQETQIERLKTEGAPLNVFVREDGPVHPEGIVKISGPMAHVIKVASKYAVACGTNYKDVTAVVQAKENSVGQ